MNKSSLNNNVVYNAEKPVVSILFETDTSKEIRIVMKAGQIMKEHKTPYAITVEIFEGEIYFGIKNEITKLTKGDLVWLNGNVPHDLKAIKNSIVRLTLSKLDSVERVQNVSKG